MAFGLPLQHQDPVHQSFSGRGAPRHVNINGDDPVDSPDDAVRIVVVPTSVGAATHGNHPLGLRHLVVDLPNGRGHFIGDRPGHDYHVGLPRGRPEHHSVSVKRNKNS